MTFSQTPKKQGDGTPIRAESPRVGDEEILSTANFADKCTWFWESTRVTGETLTVDSEDATGKTFESAHPYWIDMLTGRLLNQDKWRGGATHEYLPVIKVDGTEQSIREFPGDPGTYDCEILYVEGKVRFLGDAPTGTVTADYSYESGSVCAIEPDEDKVLKIESGEADFSIGDANGKHRVIFTTEIDYDIWGYAWYYAPQYESVRAHAAGNVTLSGAQTIDDVVLADGDQVACFNQTDPTEDGFYVVSTSGAWSRSLPAGYGVAGFLYFPQEGTTYARTGQLVVNSSGSDVLGTDNIVIYQYFDQDERVELAVDKYQRSLQIIMEAKGAYAPIDPVGATDAQLANLDDDTWTLDEFRRQSRGFVSRVQPVPFPYETVRELESAKGHQLRVGTKWDLSFGGENCTLTFYCTSWDE